VLRIGPPGGPLLLIAERLDGEEGAALLASAAPLRADIAVAPRRGSVAALAPGFTAAVGARWLLVSTRELPAHRRRTIAAAWRLPAERVYATARAGALAVDLRAGLPPRVLRHADGRMDGLAEDGVGGDAPADASPGPSALGYHPEAR
jgi:hypothetical protein